MSGQLWMKLSPHLLGNGKVQNAGLDATAVYLAALSANFLESAHGTLTMCQSTPAALCARVGFGWSIRRTAKAIAAAIQWELLERSDDGGLRIVGWGPEWESNYRSEASPVTVGVTPERSRAASRTARWRDRKASRSVTGDVTRDVTHRHGDASHPVTERHGDASRSVTRARASQRESEGEVPPPTPPSGGEGPSKPGPDPDQSPTDQASDPELPDLIGVLRAAGYRSKSPSFVVPGRAKALRAEGLTPQDARQLVNAANAKSNSKDATALLAHWLDNGLWREVLDEARMKAKERALHARGEAAKPKDVLEELAHGVYGEDPKPIAEAGRSLHALVGAAPNPQSPTGTP